MIPASEEFLARTHPNLLDQYIADIRDISINFERGRSLIEFTAYPYSETITEAQSAAFREQMMQALDTQLRLELSEPFAIRALIVDSRQKLADSMDSNEKIPPQTK